MSYELKDVSKNMWGVWLQLYCIDTEPDLVIAVRWLEPDKIGDLSSAQ